MDDAARKSSERDGRIAFLENELADTQAREQDLNDFLENALLGLHWLDANGVIIRANQAELELLGYSRSEYVGRNIVEFHADPVAIRDILRRLTDKETLRNYEAWLRHKDGSLRYVQISSNVRWNKGEFVHTRCLTRDITDRKRREQRLLTQNGVGRTLASASTFEDAAPDLLEQVGRHLGLRAGYLWIREGNRLHCAASWADDAERYRGFSDGCEEFPFDDPIGFPSRIWNSREPQWVTDLAGGHESPSWNLAARLGLRSAFGFPIVLGEEARAVMEFFTDELRAPDKELLEMTAAVGRQIGEFLERTEVRQRLAEREESYRVLTETASDGIVTIDGGSNILFANSPAAEMFGYTREELIGSNMTVVMPERLRDTHLAAVSHVVATGERHLHSWRIVQLTGLHRHGYEFPLEVSFGAYWQGSKPVFVGVLRDTTERTRLEEGMRQAAKLESLGVLAGGIAHDFNNLLTGILGNISLADEMLPGDHPAKPALEDAMEASERASHLTRQMLAYAGKGKFVVQPIDISELVREISALVRTSIPKHVAIRLDLGASLPPVEADSAQLQQLVMNLVINGAEAVPADRRGIVLVTTRLQKVSDSGEAEPGAYVAISVQDNGSGMDDATRAKIFDPFFTTKFTGRGLGLAAASGIVKGHKGLLRVFSTPGQGTTFRVLLPAGRGRAQEVPPGRTATDLSGLGTILVVDDEEIVRKVAATSLRRYGYTVVTAENGRTGVEQFRQTHSDLAAVILDVTMPVMNGEHALALMKSINPAVPVVLSSGYSEAEATVRFEGQGLAAFLQKPYTAKRLAEKINAVLRARIDAEISRGS
ncbi:MAG: signal transduction histidine kinase [Bryobacterales bacterium]|nr:signal transduction histidine kinase [Bryobacterales bacterium]